MTRSAGMPSETPNFTEMTDLNSLMSDISQMEGIISPETLNQSESWKPITKSSSAGNIIKQFKGSEDIPIFQGGSVPQPGDMLPKTAIMTVNELFHTDEVATPEFFNPDASGKHPPNHDPDKLTWRAPGSWAVAALPNIDVEQYMYGKELQTLRDDTDERQLYYIRVFKRDSMFITITCNLYATNIELRQALAKKSFINTPEQFALQLYSKGVTRLLHDKDRPLMIQRLLLEDAGFTENDYLHELGRDDNSYLYRFTVVDLDMLASTERDPDSDELDMERANMPSIPIRCFKGAERLRVLNLSHNPGLKIPLDFMQLCTNLTELKLSGMDFTQVPAAIRESVNLQFLCLSGNRLTSINTSVFANMNSLVILELQDNQLTSLVDCKKWNPQLTTLNLCNNCFGRIPSIVMRMEKLEELDISFNNLTEMDPDIHLLTGLKRFYVVANDISGQFPNNVSRMRHLREVNIQRNNFSSIQTLLLVASLELLFADNNAISEVTVGRCNVRELSLSNNPIIKFHVEHLIPSLLYLNLESCKLTALTDNICLNFVHLQHLILNFNHLVTLPRCIGNLKDLKVLSCTNNALNSLPSDIYEMSSLRVIDVRSNNIEEIPPEIWWCSKLSTLNASSNMLESFPQPINQPFQFYAGDCAQAPRTRAQRARTEQLAH